MPEPTMPEQRLREVLLQKVYNGNASDLKNDIGEMRTQGATSDYSALKKIVRTKGTRTLESNQSVALRFIQLYHRRPRKNAPREEDQERGYSAYGLNNDGIHTIHFADGNDIPDPRKVGLKMECGEAQLWTGLEKHENVITGTTWLHAPRGAAVKPAGSADVGKTFWQASRPVNRITDGQGVWNAWISGVFPVAEWNDGERGEDLPILGDGGDANLSLGLSDTYDNKTGRAGTLVSTTKIKNVQQLKTLLGDIFDEPMLMSDKAIGELRDALNGQPVIVFGTGQTPGGNQIRDAEIKAKMKRPTIKLSGGLGLVVTYEPPARETPTED
jgi:hypothetical protein